MLWCMAYIDLVGRHSGRWTVLKHDTVKNGKHYWVCRCFCGNECSVRGYLIYHGISQSCGCRAPEIARKQMTTHGLTEHPNFSIWWHMIQRCHNPKDTSFFKYGAKGIRVCLRWRHDLRAFISDMGNRPKGLTLDRIDGTKGYTPKNCRWATYKEQNRNRKDNRLITCRGQIKTMAEWADISTVKYGTIKQRLNHGWSPEDALFQPTRVGNY